METHATHYCKVCKSKDSDHRAFHCPMAGGGSGASGAASAPATKKWCRYAHASGGSGCRGRCGVHWGDYRHDAAPSKGAPAGGGKGGGGRNRRLDSNVKELYHQTDEEGWKAIKAGGWKLKRGKSTCLAGSGIYFAVSERDTDRKAHTTGIMLTCSVRLGKVKKVSFGGDTGVTFASLQKEGCDSVEIPRNGTEYVVYNFDQVKIVSHKKV